MVDVMSRNLYFGADLSSAISASSIEGFVAIGEPQQRSSPKFGRATLKKAPGFGRSPPGCMQVDGLVPREALLPPQRFRADLKNLGVKVAPKVEHETNSRDPSKFGLLYTQTKLATHPSSAADAAEPPTESAPRPRAKLTTTTPNRRISSPFDLLWMMQPGLSIRAFRALQQPLSGSGLGGWTGSIRSAILSLRFLRLEQRNPWR